jgi:hypothetical protein
MLAEKLCQSLNEWGIDQRRIIMVVTDNGTNMIKAVRVINEPQSDSETEEELYDDAESDTDVDVDPLKSHSAVTLHRLPCIPHTLQLVLKEVEKTNAYHNILGKAKNLTRKIRMSSVATEKMILYSGRTVVAECVTRWSSNLLMIESLLQLKDHIEKLCSDMNWDCFLTSEWVKLTELFNILKPFANHTNLMQTDKFALSNVIPVLLDLSGHLSHSHLPLARSLQVALQKRFDSLLNPDSPEFDALPSAACLLDPAVASILMTPDTVKMLAAAKTYICHVKEVRNYYLITICERCKNIAFS